jgi:hypothetical protein
MVKHVNYCRNWQAIWGQIYGITLGVIAVRIISICVVFQWQIMKKRANYELTGDRTAAPCYYPSDDCWGRALIGAVLQLHYTKSSNDQGFHTTAGLSIKIRTTCLSSSSIRWHINMLFRYSSIGVVKLRRLRWTECVARTGGLQTKAFIPNRGLSSV